MTTLSLILLHGLGASGNDMQPIAQAITARLQTPQRNIRIHCPDAPARPVTVNGGYVMPAWFDLYSLEAHTRMDIDGIEQNRQRISQLIAAELAAGILPEHIILGGFSQGGVIAMHCALHQPQRLGGLLALSTWLPHTDLPSPSHAACQTPVFIGHGTDDDLIPLQAAHRTQTTLAELGYTTILQQSYPMPHSISMEEIDDMSAWLTQHLAL
ncbi:MAG: alpha/beta hydrolase [Halothiobacillaceae bacterium]